VNALAIAATHFDKYVDIVKFDNNNMPDKEVGKIINAMSSNKKIQGVSVRRN